MALPPGITNLNLPQYTNRHENFTVNLKPNTSFNLRLPFDFNEREKKLPGYYQKFPMADTARYRQ
jgi:hypothetical protein